MMEQNKLPQWSDCELAVDEGRATPLEKFIYDYEPGDDDRAWRERLLAALTTARKEARAAAFKESAEFFCHWLLRAYETIHRDTSYEEGENLDSVAREINQVIGFAGYEPESTARERLLAKRFSWNALHIEAAASDAEGAGDG